MSADVTPSGSHHAEPSSYTKHVVIVQEWLPQYRVPLFEALKARLSRDGIRLSLVHGDPSPGVGKRGDTGQIDWAVRSQERRIGLSRRFVRYQRIPQELRPIDLVVLPHRLADVRTAMRAIGVHPRDRFAYWGQALLDRGSPVVSGALKRSALRADWWFTYTDVGAARLDDAGYPGDRITVLRNTIAGPGLGNKDDHSELSPVVRRWIEEAQTVCCTLGALTEDRLLPLVIDCGRRVHAEMPDFRLVIAGSGPMESVAKRAAAENSWVEYLGPCFGDSKWQLLANTEILIMPGRIGLLAVDSLLTGTPIVTQDDVNHSVEYEYLTPGRTCVTVPRSGNGEPLAASTIALLADRTRLKKMQDNCRQAACLHSLEDTVERFATGIVGALHS